MANETELSKQYSQEVNKRNYPLSFEPDILLAVQYIR